MGGKVEKLYGGKDLWKRWVLSLEWKWGVMDGDSGDEGKDELTWVRSDESECGHRIPFGAAAFNIDWRWCCFCVSWKTNHQSSRAISALSNCLHRFRLSNERLCNESMIDWLMNVMNAPSLFYMSPLWKSSWNLPFSRNYSPTGFVMMSGSYDSSLHKLQNFDL